MKEQTPGTRQLLFKGKDEKPPGKRVRVSLVKWYPVRFIGRLPRMKKTTLVCRPFILRRE